MSVATTGAEATGSAGGTAAAKIIVRSALYYAVVSLIGALAWRYLPRTHLIASESLDSLFGSTGEVVRGGSKTALQAPDQGTLAATVAVAMLGAGVLALPVAWIYTLTRSIRGYQQSIVQLLIVLPVVIAGVIVLVKYSVALAFGLGGVVAAVRFRNSLDDSKDAVYVFLVVGLGMAAAVDLPVALVISIVFNALVIILWVTDFGRTPVALEGKVAERRLARARQLARTGTFVARIDDEVLQNMTAEQLEGVAQRAWRRARQHHPESDAPAAAVKADQLLRLTLRDADRLRPLIEAKLAEATKKWRLKTSVSQPDGATLLEYTIQLKKKVGTDELIALVRAVGGAELVDAGVQ